MLFFASQSYSDVERRTRSEPNKNPGSLKVGDVLTLNLLSFLRTVPKMKVNQFISATSTAMSDAVVEKSEGGEFKMTALNLAGRPFNNKDI